MEKRTVIIGEYNTALTGSWTLTGLELSNPTMQANLVYIPGRDGFLDLSAALTGGEPRYQDRTLNITLENSDGTREDRERRIREMIAELDGYSMQIWLPDDPEHYLVGRVRVVREYNDLAHAAVSVTATCDPWLYKNSETIHNLTATSEAQKAILVNSGRRTVTPVVVVTGTVDLKYGEYAWTLAAGTYQLPDLVLTPGSHELTYNGAGTVTVTYREAVLL